MKKRINITREDVENSRRIQVSGDRDLVGRFHRRIIADLLIDATATRDQTTGSIKFDLTATPLEEIRKTADVLFSDEFLHLVISLPE